MKSVYGRAGVRYVITKFSRMDSLPNFVIHGAPLKTFINNQDSTRALCLAERFVCMRVCKHVWSQDVLLFAR